MSGGFFDFRQYDIQRIVEELSQVISTNNDESYDEWGCIKGRFFEKKTVKELEKGLELLKNAYIYAHRIDYLLCGDDGEATFHKRLKEDLSGKTK